MVSLSSLSPFSRSPQMITADDALTTDLYDRSRDRRLQSIRPYKHTDDGLKRGMKLLTALHPSALETQLGGLRNRSNPFAFELHYSDDTELLQSRIATQTDSQFEFVDRQVDSYYDDSTCREIDPAFLDIRPGQAVAGTVLQLRQRSETDRLRPIKSFRIAPDHFDIGPYRSITKEMVGATHHTDCDVLVQFTIKPAVSNARWDRLNWWYGLNETIEAISGKADNSAMDWGKVGRAIAEPLHQIGMSEEQRRREHRRRERQREQEERASRFIPDHADDLSLPGASSSGKLLEEYRGMRGYHINIRIIAASDDPTTANQRVGNVAEMFQSFYDSKFGQGFTTVSLSKRQFKRMLHRAAGREYVDRKVTLPVDTATGVAKIPTDIELQQYDYSMSASGLGVPPRTPRFGWDSVDIDRSASREERQRALLSITDPTHPIWYGFGTKNGVEAGVDPEVLSVHQFVGGSTGMGKTTLLINFFYQIMQRGHGGLFFDPKGRDADEIVQILPEHREDDLVFIDIGADAEFEVGFNFLEIPLEDPDPESKEFDSAVSALADDLESLLAQSGGEGSQWGSRMSGVTRAVVRGLAEYQVRTGEPITMLDMAFLVANDEGREQLHRMMSEERIEWIQQATHVISEYSQSDLEPLYRRLWEWMFSRTVRSVASHPETTISIEDIVRDGKLVVVRNRSSGDTPKRLIATALIRRLWVAIREQSNRDGVPDPPAFYVVCDEFDKIVSEHSDIHNILREARAFDFSLTVSAQNLDTGGGDNVGIPESIQKAIRGNCKTFLSFDPGEDDATGIARQHSKNIDAEDVKELSKFHIYMRTNNDRDEKTDSYKAHALYPAPEILADVRSEEETEALISRSQERYGQRPRSDDEIHKELLVSGTATESTQPGTESNPLKLTDDRRAAVCEAILDESIIADNDNGAVGIENCRERIRAYHDDPEALDHDSQVDALLDAMPTDEEDGLIERWEDENNDVWLRPTAEGQRSIFYTGNSPTSGGLRHRELLKNSYAPLMKLDGRVTLPEQDGKTMPDGWMSLAATPLGEIDAEALSAREQQIAIENFVDEYPMLSRVALGSEIAADPSQAAGEFPAQTVDGRGIALEAESTTGNSNPYQTCLNVARVINNGQRCLLLCRPGTSENVWKTLTSPPFYSQKSNEAAGEQILYNGGDLTIDGQQILRPAAAQYTVWKRDTVTGEYICGDSDGNEYCRFKSATAVFEEVDAYPETLPEGHDVPDHLTGVKIPFIPERMFDAGEIPDRDAWDVVEVPPDATDPADLSIFEDGEPIPLDDWSDRETSPEAVLETLSGFRENGREAAANDD